MAQWNKKEEPRVERVTVWLTEREAHHLRLYANAAQVTTSQALLQAWKKEVDKFADGSFAPPVTDQF